jgi:hypothetical protein
MAYATVEQLAKALKTRVTAENTAGLQACLDAAALEIDRYVDRDVPPTQGTPEWALAERENILRAVEWARANDYPFGFAGFEETGVLMAPKDVFGRHAAALHPLKQHWGVA